MVASYNQYLDLLDANHPPIVFTIVSWAFVPPVTLHSSLSPVTITSWDCL
jgi:hypothetical protein